MHTRSDHVDNNPPTIKEAAGKSIENQNQQQEQQEQTNKQTNKMNHRRFFTNILSEFLETGHGVGARWENKDEGHTAVWVLVTLRQVKRGRLYEGFVHVVKDEITHGYSHLETVTNTLKLDYFSWRPFNSFTAKCEFHWTKKTSKSWTVQRNLKVWPLKWKLSTTTF